MGIRTFDRAMVAVGDLAAATARYAALLGRGPALHGQHPELGTDHARFVLQGGGLELLGPARPGALTDRVVARLEEDGEGLMGMVLGCDDLEATAAALRGRGLRVGDTSDVESWNEAARGARHSRTAPLHEGDTRGLWVLLTDLDEAPEDPAPAAAPADCVHALDHLVVETADPAGAISRFRDGMGLRLALDRTFENRGLRLLFFRFGGMTLELSALVGAPAGDLGPDRFHGLAYRVADAAAAHRRLARGGFDLSPVRDGHKPGTRVFTLRDGTHGVPTLIIEDPGRRRPGAQGRPVDA